ncbi:MaoC family dehydratase N-terminal domain-containing protein [Dactylosporangium sp. NPDC051485]|uniref:FAS1-like dehydratase domain-containing protein n=1 Tax=Dactylosporangium sp. NPDC051485 TaxID=3154846 RepID=UPI00341378D5
MTQSHEQPLVGDDARAFIGKVTNEAEGIVVKKEFQRWAAAVKDRNPLYFDADFARAHGYRDVIAPPLYVQYVTLGVADLDQLRPDGIPGGTGSGDIPLPRCPRRMAGGDDMTFYEPIYDGDVIRAVRTVTDIHEKKGRSGAFVLVTSTTVYTRQDGTVVAENNASMIARP